MIKPELEKINLLIVDDRPENIIALEALLQNEEVNLISTTLPNEALRICWEMDISIAMIDVQMPGMDGFELVEILKSNPRTKDILVIFVTAISTETKYALKGLHSGAVDYLYKPLNPYLVAAKVNSFLTLVRYQNDIKNKNRELEAFQKLLIEAKDHAEQGKKIKENFLANMSHEIRTPINGIIGIATLLHKTTLSPEQLEMISLLQTSSESLLGVINDILDLSKIEAGKFKITRSETDLIKNCVSIVNLLQIRAKEKDISLTMELDEQLPPFIKADSLRLNQILMNLIGNAIKFTHIGGVTLKVELIDQKLNSAQIKFSVTDTGIGIAKDNIAKIFDTFEQADDQTTLQFGGTGLGLSIVKNLAELKGGELEVTSEKNVGSVFSFTNWYELVQGKAVDSSLSATTFAPFENANILVAEDNLINQFVIRKVLSDWNITFDVVGNGQEAIEKLHNNVYDLILMDTFMPIMSGLEAIRLIRAGEVPGKEHIAIITFSAAVLDDDKKTAITAGANDVVSKPFEMEVLYNKIKLFVK